MARMGDWSGELARGRPVLRRGVCLPGPCVPMGKVMSGCAQVFAHGGGTHVRRCLTPEGLAFRLGIACECPWHLPLRARHCRALFLAT